MGGAPPADGPAVPTPARRASEGGPTHFSLGPADVGPACRAGHVLASARASRADGHVRDMCATGRLEPLPRHPIYPPLRQIGKGLNLEGRVGRLPLRPWLCVCVAGGKRLKWTVYRNQGADPVQLNISIRHGHVSEPTQAIIREKVGETDPTLRSPQRDRSHHRHGASGFARGRSEGVGQEARVRGDRSGRRICWPRSTWRSTGWSSNCVSTRRRFKTVIGASDTGSRE